RMLVLLAVLAASPMAHAQAYDAPPEVSARREGDGGVAHASMDVRAAPAAVWAVLSDCAQARRFMEHLLSWRALERAEGWDVREPRVRGWPLRPVMRNVSRIELEPNRRLSFHRVEGDWTRSDGEWVLTPIDAGQGTHVEYRVSAALRGPLPAGISQSFLVG